ncbi:hypothetical protein IMCC3317_42200 [Kordia antarctica]|uniref:Uncharacterized protein n=1 Tax=Kordia antarctica TaxID=1218801 RepID=A0A7L4ZQP1_9FLAO|nr:hypothetical protein [Kordia antarctica]QHI38820.1 hypothetical protein IMCC3317_42200 [Kordia antarctica]
MKSIHNPLFKKNEIYDLGSIQGAGDCHTTQHKSTTDPRNEHITCDHSKDKCVDEIQ